MRYYTYNDIELPSVTTITGILDKPALMYWAANCTRDYILEQLSTFELNDNRNKLLEIINDGPKNFRKVSKKARDIGSQTHEAIEEYLKTGKEPYKPGKEVETAFTAFLEWKDAVNLQPVSVEKTVFCDMNFGYAGTLDLIADITIKNKTKRFVIDFKTSKAIYKPEYNLQCAAYRGALKVESICANDINLSIEGNAIVRLDKATGFPQFKDFSDSYLNDVEAFMTLAKFFYLTHNWKGKQK